MDETNDLKKIYPVKNVDLEGENKPVIEMACYADLESIADKLNLPLFYNQRDSFYYLFLEYLILVGQMEDEGN